jgi:TRAP-type C4-dicarboxylate transport system permease small subunit
MLDNLIKARKALVKVLEITVMIAMGVLVIDVLWGVATRFPSRLAEDMPMPAFLAAAMGSVKPSAWTGELATMLLIWVSLLGASVAFIEKSHLGVDYFVGKLPPRAKAVVELVVYVLIGFFAASAMMFGGYKLISLTLMTKQTSAALGIKMGYVYMALPISGFFVLIFTIETLIERAFVLFGNRGEVESSADA